MSSLAPSRTVTVNVAVLLVVFRLCASLRGIVLRRREISAVMRSILVFDPHTISFNNCEVCGELELVCVFVFC